jgi:hypothetical protein
MIRLMQKVLTIVAIAAGALATATLPASASHTPAPLVPRPGAACPPNTFCGWTQTNFTGRQANFTSAVINIDPPLRSLVNNTILTWCVYTQPNYTGTSRAITSGATIATLRHAVRSARPVVSGRC